MQDICSSLPWKNQNYWNMASFSFRIMQHLIATVMCKTCYKPEVEKDRQSSYFQDSSSCHDQSNISNKMCQSNWVLFCMMLYYCIVICAKSFIVQNVPYHLEYKTHILNIFSRWKIEVRLKFKECSPFKKNFLNPHSKTGCILNLRVSHIQNNVLYTAFLPLTVTGIVSIVCHI
jgi:hypothetical protein